MNEVQREQMEVLDLAHVFIRDMDSRITFWNTGDARMYGYTAEEAVGRVSHELLKTDFPVPLKDIEAELLRSGEWQGELTQMRRDGQQIVVASYWVLHKDENGNPTSILEVNNDITESKRAEESLEQSNRRLEILSETASQLLVTDNPQRLVQSLCESVMQFLGCHLFLNYLVDEERDCLHLNACAGIPEEAARSIEWLDYGAAVRGCAARDRGRMVAENIRNNPDPRTELVKSLGIQAYVCHPLFAAGGRVIGTLSFGSRTKTCFTDDELDLMRTIANQVATAMERIRAERQLAARAQELEEANAGLEAMTERLRCETEEHRASQEALREREELLRGIIDNIPVYLVIWDGRLRQFQFNQAFRHDMGWTEEDATKGDFMAKAYPDPEYRRQVEAYMQSHEAGFRDLKTTSKDGRQVDISWANVYLSDDTSIGIGVNITERKRSEEALKQSEEKYRTLFQTMQEAFFVVEVITDEQGTPIDWRYVDVNEQTVRYMRMSREQLVGHTYSEVVPNPDPTWIATLGRVALTGEPTSQELFAPTRQRWLQITSYSPLPGQAATLFTDVTERKQAQEALKESRQDLERAQAVSHTGSWRLDLRNRVLLWSDETYRIFEVPRETRLTYEAFLSLVHPDDREYVDERWKAALRGEGYDIEHRIIAGGQVKWVRERAELEFDKNGRLISGFGTVQDVTEIKRAQEAAVAAEESKVEFYRRSISAATDGRFEITDRSEIEKIAGPAIASWQIDKPEDLIDVRHGVADKAEAAGMDPSVVGKFVLAVGEAATNAIKHAGGGTASLHRSGDSLFFMVEDQGPGMETLSLPEVALRTRYSTAGTLGVGYKVMMKTADRVYLATGPEGTAVGVQMSLHPSETPAPVAV